MSGRRRTIALLVLLLVPACGTTVPLATQRDQQVGARDALSLPQSRTASVPGDVAPDSRSTGPAGAPSATGPAAAPAGGSATTPRSQPGGLVRTPLKLGMLYTINDAAAGAGVDNGNSFTPEAAFKGLVRAWNARGGLAGRRIDPVYVAIRSSSTSLAADLEAACQTFTHDSSVAAVLASTGIYVESFGSCLARTATPLVTADYAMGDDTALAAVPGYLTTSTISTDQRLRVMLERLVAVGRITRADKLGVVVEGCAFDQRTYNRTVLPTARRLGLTVAEQVGTRCFSQIGDLAGQAGDMQNAVLRFSTSHVTQVLFVSGSVEGNLMLYFATAAQAQGYHPHYALTSAVAPVIQEQNTPKEQLARAAGLGWLPSLDRGADSRRTPPQARCLADLTRGAGVTPASGTDRFFAFSTCDAFVLYDGALLRTAGHTALADVLAAVHALRFVPAATPAADFTGARRTGVAQGRVFAWSTGCGCFDYAGAPFSLL